MTPEQIKLVQDSFGKVVPIRDEAAALFYQRLFEIAPEVRPLFKGDMTQQGAKLMAMLGAVVNGLNDVEKIVPVARDLAVRHIAYGVEAGHYQSVGQALLETLEKGLGAEFTNDVKDSWLAAYQTLSGVMIAAAYPTEVSS
ncbi:globin family protein [Pseudaestuariivita rosea]|uniref:globin family protein n=1 Tax=Pseudaestuariivita rosea TaxID=2763263 RepID=UPI001ABA744B|nr:globin family protein [Pseudaestuariivita rosea]